MTNYEFDKNVNIKNTHIYKLDDNSYYVSFDAKNRHETFYGPKEQVLSQLSLRLKRIFHVR